MWPPPSSAHLAHVSQLHMAGPVAWIFQDWGLIVVFAPFHSNRDRAGRPAVHRHSVHVANSLPSKIMDEWALQVAADAELTEISSNTSHDADWSAAETVADFYDQQPPKAAAETVANVDDKPPPRSAAEINTRKANVFDEHRGKWWRTFTASSRRRRRRHGGQR